MNKLRTEQAKEIASQLYVWLRKKPKSFQIAALQFLTELLKATGETR